MKLIIGNKNYSSWSMRPWLALKTAGIPFEEEFIWLQQPDTTARIKAVAPNSRIPVLVDGDLTIFESIAILEYVAELAPALWPANAKARAHARSISAEMHAGFVGLRNRCPMNIKRKPSAIVLASEVQAEVDRIVALLSDTRARFGSGGDFLFGAFGNADAMYAPVVNRLHAYDIPVPADVRRYLDAVMATNGWQEWEREALAETRVNAVTDALA